MGARQPDMGSRANCLTLANMAEAGAVPHTWYSSNVTQLIIMSMTVFACPGMFNALNSIGLGGDPSVGQIVNCCLYGARMCTSFFVSRLQTISNKSDISWVTISGAETISRIFASSCQLSRVTIRLCQ